jgi:hypothetical protein
MVVDFTVVGDDDLSIFVGQGLCTAGEINCGQSYMRKTDALAGVKPVAVRAAMPNRCSHPPKRLDSDSGWIATRDAGDTAHRI